MDHQNMSQKFIEHIKSAHVVIQPLKYECEECGASYNCKEDYQLHLVSHAQYETSNNENGKRFIKLHKCLECGAKFVKEKNLKAHNILHEPFPYICDCGIGFYANQDLRTHKSLVHASEIKQKIEKLTFRQQRAVMNEVWVPQINYTGPKIKTEIKDEKRSVKPKLRAELVVKKKGSKKETIYYKRDNSSKPYYCNICDKRFTQSGTLKLHLKLHAGIKEYGCSYCGKEFSLLFNMQQHERIHTGEKPHKCSFCPKAFSDRSAYTRHERTHTGVKPYACNFCEMRFSDASGRIAHEKRHKKQRDFKCEHCPKQFYTDHDLRKHRNTVHSLVKNFVCHLCPKSFALKSYLYIHMKVHNANSCYECDYCGHKNNSKYNLALHIFRNHTKKKKTYKCRKCDMKFDYKINLKKHYHSMHERSVSYECDQCGEKANRKSDIYRHIVNKHLNIKCKVCLKAFPQRIDLEKHKIRGCIRCQICNKALPSNFSLSNHIAWHNNDKPYNCDFCIKNFSTKPSLIKHYNNVHSEVRKYECNDCGKKFTNRYRITDHIFNIHMNFLYCNVCMKKFICYTDLQIHKSKGCTRDKFKCQICKKELTSKSSLQDHIHFHSNIKNFVCDYCKKQYTRRSQVLRHIKLMHMKTKTNTLRKKK